MADTLIGLLSGSAAAMHVILLIACSQALALFSSDDFYNDSLLELFAPC